MRAAKADSKARIDHLSAVRGGTTVLSYVTATRPWFEVPMAMDVVPIFYEHLRLLHTPKQDTRIDLLIHSNGGDSVVPWRLVTLLREYCSHLAVLVPSRAYSAATLLALGADEVVMHPMGVLGPTDPTVTTPYNPVDPRNQQQVLGISVEDVASYIDLVREDVGIHHEDELVQAFLALTNAVHPLALGSVKRSTSQSRLLGEKLLSARNAGDVQQHESNEIIKSLTSQLYYHGHPISRSEARDSLGLKFVKDASDDEETSMWDLFCCYADLLELERPYRPVDRFTTHARPLGGPNEPPKIFGPYDLPPVIGAVVESTERADHFEVKLELTVQRDWNGMLTGHTETAGADWSRVR